MIGVSFLCSDTIIHPIPQKRNQPEVDIMNFLLFPNCRAVDSNARMPVISQYGIGFRDFIYSISDKSQSDISVSDRSSPSAGGGSDTRPGMDSADIRPGTKICGGSELLPPTP